MDNTDYPAKVKFKESNKVEALNQRSRCGFYLRMRMMRVVDNWGKRWNNPHDQTHKMLKLLANNIDEEASSNNWHYKINKAIKWPIMMRTRVENPKRHPKEDISY
ncbi:hypothetical protein KFK09_024643 [Dendrobium nobile]|uniref:Uncharacterized protein n=1 Tax=Dendrobium nobile TaxID=94219 RepID=A0A8T3AJU8_DENNO|nr:hypothetical protein KFK09_024643 [Dendrobium nobile]